MINYRHQVFTVPDLFRTYFYNNQDLLEKLIKTGNNCLIDILQACAKIKLKIGTIVVLQTNGRSGQYNPHLHILFTGGGLDKKGKWHSVSYIPFELIHRKWQYHLLTMLAEEVDRAKIQPDIDSGWKNHPKGFVAFLEKAKVPAGGKGLAEYLAKYVTSPPISVRRIEQYDGRTVSYWYRDHKTKSIQHETIPALTFIGRMVQHILPKGFQRIRYYGLHGSSCYAKDREYISNLFEPGQCPADPDGYQVLPRPPFAELFKKSFGKEPLTCPGCGDTMQLELIFHPKYGVIKEYELYKEISDDDPFTKRSTFDGRSMDQSQRMVQLLLPFM